METVHFIDEHLSHYEALLAESIDEHTANLYVWCYGHVRIVKRAPYSAEYNAGTWHRASLQGNKSVCERDGGFVTLTAERRAIFHRTVEQGA